MSRARIGLTSLTAGITFFVLAGCAGSKESRSADTAAAAASTADTGMAGMDHSNMPGMTAAAKDADQEFLRKMSDHHEGIIVMLDAAMDKATSATAKADARKVHDKQHPERDQMVAMLKSGYNETHTPTPMASAKAMIADLEKKTGAAYDRDMYGHIVMHHQEGIKMMDDFLPRLQNPELRQMVQKMRADQQREIQEFQRKQGA